ncbi:hypothetical protein SDC9_22218 [bioreactor metagenome]|jgi:hypothetical protein|uniref:DUF6305 domain-containing protein n=1 Tax=bioreactor metagenome TaxID=1076179 RepID=A0A644UBL2_9ZZZZ|nr:DUF6305 family protein [Acidaminococcaceae bacterium]
MKKRTLCGCILAIACVIFAGCGGAKQDAKPAASSGAAVSGLKAAEFEQPALITSIGQSADAQMVKALAERNGLKYKFDVAARPAALDGNKTLMMVIGGSSKGMGAAGVNLAQEEERAKALIAAAKEKKMKIIALHVGGSARRGELTDRFIPLTKDANYLIVVADGDKDKAFTKIASSDKQPIDFPANVADVGKFMKAAFK